MKPTLKELRKTAKKTGSTIEKEYIVTYKILKRPVTVACPDLIQVEERLRWVARMQKEARK